VYTLLKPLADERLITTGYDPVSEEETVEVSHEALIRAWPTLGAWITTARADLRFQIQLEEAAKEWDASSENTAFLWSGLRLDNAEAWVVRAQPRLNARDQRFLDASRAQRQAQLDVEHARIAAEEAARERERGQTRTLAASALRLRRRAWYLASALGFSLIAATIAGWYWYRATAATEQANQNERRAFAQFLVAKGQAVYNDEPLLGVRLALEGLTRLPQNDPAHTDVVSTTNELLAGGRLRKLANDTQASYSAPDGTVSILILARTGALMCYSDDGTCTTLSLTGRVIDVSFSPDSAFFVVRYDGKPVELRRRDSGQVVPITGSVTGVSFSPDSAFYIVSYADKPSELRRSDSGQVVPLTGSVGSITFSPDSAFFVVHRYDTPGELRRSDSDQVVPITGKVSHVSFSPDSAFFVVSYFDTPGELWVVQDQPRRLIRNITEMIFVQKSHSAIARYTDGQVYFLNLAWIMRTRHSDTLPEAALIKLACTELLAPAHFDEKTLQLYLGNQTPEACH
jgi:hypothetical protein